MVKRIGEMAEILKSSASKFDQFEEKPSMFGFLKVHPMILQSNWFFNQHLIFDHKKNYFLDNHTCTTVTAFFLPRGAIDNVILFSTSASFFLAFIIPEIIE